MSASVDDNASGTTTEYLYHVASQGSALSLLWLHGPSQCVRKRIWAARVQARRAEARLPLTDPSMERGPFQCPAASLWTIPRASRPQEQHGTQRHCPQRTTLAQLLPSRPDTPEVSAEANHRAPPQRTPADRVSRWRWHSLKQTSAKHISQQHTPSRHTWATPLNLLLYSHMLARKRNTNSLWKKTLVKRTATQTEACLCK